MKNSSSLAVLSFALLFGFIFIHQYHPFRLEEIKDYSLGYAYKFAYFPISSFFPDTISVLIMEAIDAERIKENLRILTKEPHMAGTPANGRVGDAVAKLWKEAGLEDVHVISYKVLLSYPDYEKPNRVFISSSKGEEVFSTSGSSPVILPDEQSAKYAGHQWLAYAAPGTVSADVVYANRGFPNDFEYLKSLGIDVKGKIVLMRYGEGFRGDKVHEAQENGAIGAILFSDPDDVARDGPNRVYPKTYWMPTEGVQRGSILHGSGDPLTPLYPSKEGIFRSRTEQEARKEGILPLIPSLPISYSTAYQILKRLKGPSAPSEWQGGVNVTYKLGPGFKNDEKLKMEVHGHLETREIRNVVGYIKGASERDRYVILGNHYDAWVYGSIDPNSGTAVLAEVARSMAKSFSETNTRPDRTIMFIAWDGEEHFLLGSTEFVEEYVNILQQRAVIYINMDCLYGNTSIHVTTTPTIYDAVIKAAKKVPNPNREERRKGRKTLYDTWIATFPSEKWSRPDMPLPGGGSDHAPFLNYAGVPVVDFKFRNATTRDNYPLYHSLYETPYVNEHLLDNDGFSIHKAVGQFWSQLALEFAYAPFIPLNITKLGVMLNCEYLPDLSVALNPLKTYVDAIKPAEDQLLQLTDAAQDFFDVANIFDKRVQQEAIDKKSANERIMSIERCFINPRGMPGSPQSRHVLFSVSSKNSYSSSVMAAVYDSISEFKKATTEEERIARGREIAQQISIVHYSVNCAINTLKDEI